MSTVYNAAQPDDSAASGHSTNAGRNIMLLSSDWLAHFRCPVCGTGLSDCAIEFTCDGCHTCYPIVDGIPILINDKASLFPIAAFCQRQQTFFHPGGRLRQAVSGVLPTISKNLRAARNYRMLEELLTARHNQPQKPKVLVLGGSVTGAGMAEFLSSSALDILETDVCFGPNTKLICDAHNIPFADHSVDCVVAQAVLEHVADPWRCVSEMKRVLRPDGLVYVEVPFMQAVHNEPYDYHRFTFIGLRRLMDPFCEKELGACCGPAMALAGAYQHLLLSFTENPNGRAAINIFVRCTAWWLKYFDYYLLRRQAALWGASGLFFIGRVRQEPENRT